MRASEPQEDVADEPLQAPVDHEQVGADLPSIGWRVVLVDGIGELVDDLEDGALLVLGASGGSWLNRSRTGPGARLRRTAQAGSVIVRSAPDRVFRFMGEPVYVAPLRQADDTLRIHKENTLAVATAIGVVGLRFWPFPVDNAFLAVVDARKPWLFEGLGCLYATLWLTTPLIGLTVITAMLSSSRVSTIV